MIFYVPLIVVQEYEPGNLRFSHFYHAFGRMWEVFVFFEKMEDAEVFKKDPRLRVVIVKFPENGPYTLRHPHLILGFL